MSKVITGQQPAFDGPSLTIITPVYVTEKFAAERLSARIAQYARYIEMYEGAIEWIILIEDSHKKLVIPSKGLSDPIIRAIHTKTGQKYSQSRLKNLGLEVARGKIVCFMDQDINVPPDAISEIIRTPCEPNTVGLFAYRQGGLVRPDLCLSCIVYWKQDDMFFEERLVGQCGGEMMYFIDFYELTAFKYNCTIDRIPDNYHDTPGNMDRIDIEMDKLCEVYAAPKVTDFSHLFKENDKKICLI
jgi:glycosyltransferase involved in cell wall biosynthesis